MTTRNRFKTILTLAVIATAILAGALADADIVVQESFDYEPGNVDARNGGIGFDGAWVSTISHGRIYETGLTAFAGGGGSILNEDAGLYFSTLPVAGSALSRYGSAGRAEAHRLISGASKAALTADDTTIWFSILIAASQNYKNMMFVFGTEAFNTDGFQLAAAGDGFGVSVANAAGNGDGSINAFVFDDSQVATFVEGAFSPAIQPGEVHHDTALIVGKINWKPNGTPDELFLFNVTNLTAEPPEGTAFASIVDKNLDQSAFDTIAMYDGNNSILDEIRFGNAFGDVVGALDPNVPYVDAGFDMIAWSDEPVQLDPNVVEKPGSDWTNLTYAWSADPDDGVVFSDAAALAPTVTITKATENPSVVALTLEVNNQGRLEPPVTDTITIDLFDDSCLAAEAVGQTAYDPTDIDGNCITAFEDFALMAAKWLDDYSLTEPAPK